MMSCVCGKKIRASNHLNATSILTKDIIIIILLVDDGKNDDGPEKLLKMYERIFYNIFYGGPPQSLIKDNFHIL